MDKGLAEQAFRAFLKRELFWRPFLSICGVLSLACGPLQRGCMCAV